MEIVCIDCRPRNNPRCRTSGRCAERPGACVTIVIFPIDTIGGCRGPLAIMPAGPDLKPLGRRRERFDGKAHQIERTALCRNDTVGHSPARSTDFRTPRAEATDAA